VLLNKSRRAVCLFLAPAFDHTERATEAANTRQAASKAKMSFFILFLL